MFICGFFRFSIDRNRRDLLRVSVLWIVFVIASNPSVRTDIHPSAFRLDLLLRTLGYNFGAAIIATLMGLPAGLVLGRGAAGSPARCGSSCRRPCLCRRWRLRMVGRRLFASPGSHLSRQPLGHPSMHLDAGRVAVGGARLRDRAGAATHGYIRPATGRP
jgi:hypothetical protein